MPQEVLQNKKRVTNTRVSQDAHPEKPPTATVEEQPVHRSPWNAVIGFASNVEDYACILLTHGTQFHTFLLIILASENYTKSLLCVCLFI